jgi:hypothetical protein
MSAYCVAVMELTITRFQDIYRTGNQQTACRRVWFHGHLNYSRYSIRRFNIQTFLVIIRRIKQTTLYRFIQFLSAFVKLRKSKVSFVMSVRLSVRMEHLCSKYTDFHEIWYLRVFLKSVKEMKFPWKSDKNKGTLHEDYYKLITFIVFAGTIKQMRHTKRVSVFKMK